MEIWSWKLLLSGFDFLDLIIFIIPWLLLIGLTIALFRNNQISTKDDVDERMDNHNNNIEIVKTRYAKGEINKKEFEQLIKDLT